MVAVAPCRAAFYPSTAYILKSVENFLLDKVVAADKVELIESSLEVLEHVDTRAEASS